jgi:hypothetical protein
VTFYFCLSYQKNRPKATFLQPKKDTSMSSSYRLHKLCPELKLTHSFLLYRKGQKKIERGYISPSEEGHRQSLPLEQFAWVQRGEQNWMRIFTCNILGCLKRSSWRTLARKISVTVSFLLGLCNFSALLFSNRNTDTSCNRNDKFYINHQTDVLHTKLQTISCNCNCQHN